MNDRVFKEAQRLYSHFTLVAKMVELAVEALDNAMNRPKRIIDRESILSYPLMVLFSKISMLKGTISTDEISFFNIVFNDNGTVDGYKMIANQHNLDAAESLMSLCIWFDGYMLENGGAVYPLSSEVFSFYGKFGDAYFDFFTTNDAQIDYYRRFMKEQFKLIITEDKQVIDSDLYNKVVLHEGTDYQKTILQVDESKKEDAMHTLNCLVGMENIKQDVQGLISFVKAQKMRKDNGLKSIPVSLHLVFTGNPGTGKTTIARILAQLYKEIGVLKTGQLIEVDRSGLVAGYVGQTAIKTQEKINDALGGILFIDEAYTLAKDGNDFGQEAIDTILKAMEDHRDDFCVIVAGYREPMTRFINSNPGLKSRFNKFFEFPDYSGEELIEIFRRMCEQNEYIITNDAFIKASNQIMWMERNKDVNFANARDIRNYFERIVSRQAMRITKMQNPTKNDVMQIIEDDL